MTDNTDYDGYFLRRKNAADTWDFIARHDPGMPRGELLDVLRRSLDWEWESLPERPRNVRSLGTDALSFAALTQLLTPDAPEITEYLRMGARGIAAAAARYIPDGDPVRVELGRFGVIELPRVTDLATEFTTSRLTIRYVELTDSGPIEYEPEPEPPHPDVALREIVYAYHAAFATNDKRALQLLDDVPMDLFADLQAQPAHRAYGLAHARGLQLVARGDGAGRKFLLEALNGWNDPGLDKEARAYALFLVGREIELAQRVGQSDEQYEKDGSKSVTFDQALRNALLDHRFFWRDIEMNPGRSQAHEPDGFIALGPLAWAAMRYRVGLPVNVRSDYLPRSVIEGRGTAA